VGHIWGTMPNGMFPGAARRAIRTGGEPRRTPWSPPPDLSLTTRPPS
jgi:hypothetical protein